MGPDRSVHNLRGRVTAVGTVVMGFCSGLDLLLGPLRFLLTFSTERFQVQVLHRSPAIDSSLRCPSLARSPALEGHGGARGASTFSWHELDCGEGGTLVSKFADVLMGFPMLLPVWPWGSRGHLELLESQ